MRLWPEEYSELCAPNIRQEAVKVIYFLFEWEMLENLFKGNCIYFWSVFLNKCGSGKPFKRRSSVWTASLKCYRELIPAHNISRSLHVLCDILKTCKSLEVWTSIACLKCKLFLAILLHNNHKRHKWWEKPWHSQSVSGLLR